MTMKRFFHLLGIYLSLGILLISSCSPVGFLEMPEVKGGINLGIDGPAVYPLVVKNMTRSVNVDRIKFNRAAENFEGSGPDSAHEKSFRLEEGDYGVVINFTDNRSTPPVQGEIKTTKVILAKAGGAANYIYFFRNRNNQITVDTDDSGTTASSSTDASDTSGSVPGSREYPLVIRNLTLSTHITGGSYSTNSINGVIPPVAAKVEQLIYLPEGMMNFSLSHNDSGSPQPITGAKAILPKVNGAANYIYFYRDLVSGKVVIDVDDNGKNVNPDPRDTITPAAPNGVVDPGEGYLVNEDAEIVIKDDLTSRDYGVLKVHNLSKSVTVTKVDLSYTGTGTHGPFALDSIRSGGSHFRSILLFTGGWNAEIYYRQDGTSAVLSLPVILKDIKPASIWGYVNHIYFYKGTDGKYHATDGRSDNPPDVVDVDPNDGALADGGNANTGSPAGKGEGSSPGALTDSNRAKYGLLIVKNLSDVDAATVSFKQAVHPVGADGAPHNWPKSFMMVPGPRQSDQKSIVLGPGDWAAKAAYTGNQTGATPEKMVSVVAGSITYAYLYKTTSGGYDITGSWQPPPGNAAQDNKTPGMVLGKDEEWVHVINTSKKTTIQDIQYFSGGSWVDVSILNTGGKIPPGQESNPDLAVPPNAWSFRFLTVGKTTYGAVVSKTFDTANQRWVIQYSDALEDVVGIPLNSSLIRIQNNSSYTVDRFYYYSRAKTSGKDMVLANTFEPAGPIAPGGKAERVVMGLPSMDDFVVQVLMTKGAHFKSVEFLEQPHNRIVQLTVNEEDVGLRGSDQIIDYDPSSWYSGYDGGSLRVTNAYTGDYPMKIFRINLLRYHAKPLVNAVYKVDLTTNPVLKGQYHQFEHISEGVYHVEVVAGVYTWPMYMEEDSHAISGGISAEPSTITYHCGDIVVSEYFRKQFFFEVQPGQEKEMNGRRGVHFQVSYSGASPNTAPYNTPDTTPITYVEFVIPPNRNGYWKTTNDTGVIGMYDSTSLHYAGIPPNNLCWPGSTNVFTTGTMTPQENIVYSSNTLLSPNHTRSYDVVLPPGKYWVRAMNARGEPEGFQHNQAARWLIIDASGADGSNIFIDIDNMNGLVSYGLPSVFNISGSLKPDGETIGNHSMIINVVLNVYEAAWDHTILYPNHPIGLPYSVTEETGDFLIRNVPADRNYVITAEFDFNGGHYTGKTTIQGLGSSAKNHDSDIIGTLQKKE